jgi:hypothetical protein
MTHHPISPNWGTAIVLSTVIGAFCFLSDQDYRDEFGQSDELVKVQQEERIKASREWAGRQQCGPGAVHEWLDNYTLQCTPKRGRVYQVAGVK